MNYTDCCPTSAVAAVAIVVLSIFYYFVKNRNILPGPRGVPYFGLYPLLSHETCHLQLEEYGKKYGDLYSFTSFGTLVINLGSAKAIREAHLSQSDCFEGRFETFNLLSYLLKEGVAFSNGELWKVQRKFFVQAFREYGLTAMRDHTAGSLYDSVASTVRDIEAMGGRPFNVAALLTDKCTQTLRKAFFGDSSRFPDEQIRRVVDVYAYVLNAMVGVKLLLMGPAGEFVFKTLPEYKQALEHHRTIHNIIKEVVQDMKSTMSDGHATCIVDQFFEENRLRREKNDPTWKYFSDQTLVKSLTQFVGEGTLSVALFVGMFLHALVEHPEEQEKIHQELLDVVGPNRLPTAEDRSNLRYTNAFMNEVMRTSNSFPLFPSLECTKETTLRGYRIPKGSVTMMNIWQAHHDPSTYDQPYKFDPSRFLSKEGKKKPELPVFFGLGKRSCIGEAFVLLTSFLFLTSIVMNFTVEDPSPGEKSHLYLMTGEMVLSLKPRK